jgi:hypothetical protein
LVGGFGKALVGGFGKALVGGFGKALVGKAKIRVLDIDKIYFT